MVNKIPRRQRRQKIRRPIPKPQTPKKAEASMEKAAGAQRQMKKKKRMASLKTAGPLGYTAQQRVDVMKSAGYLPAQIGQFMQKEGERLLQEGWERRNKGLMTPP